MHNIRAYSAKRRKTDLSPNGFVLRLFSFFFRATDSGLVYIRETTSGAYKVLLFSDARTRPRGSRVMTTRVRMHISTRVSNETNRVDTTFREGVLNYFFLPFYFLRVSSD